jgi:hypothetical protein
MLIESTSLSQDKRCSLDLETGLGEVFKTCGSPVVARQLRLAGFENASHRAEQPKPVSKTSEQRLS